MLLSLCRALFHGTGDRRSSQGVVFPARGPLQILLTFALTTLGNGSLEGTLESTEPIKSFAVAVLHTPQGTLVPSHVRET